MERDVKDGDYVIALRNVKISGRGCRKHALLTGNMYLVDGESSNQRCIVNNQFKTCIYVRALRSGGKVLGKPRLVSRADVRRATPLDIIRERVKNALYVKSKEKNKGSI